MESPLALYRRYRPETFAEVIGQDHVTEPLRAALANNRVNHAYLFSGPRGCGKTTSARILARSLNCELAPVADPCGECRSCVDLARGGPGSIDVIEIDAASHGGVDDARDLREKAFFAPVASKYKVYIIDEAHMVTTQGFNALLKLVEEPPPHLRFIFATTEPEKVLPTIRSRTHHYPFRLIPPRLLSSYLSELCEKEGVTIEPAALPLVVRAGAGLCAGHALGARPADGRGRPGRRHPRARDRPPRLHAGLPARRGRRRVRRRRRRHGLRRGRQGDRDRPGPAPVRGGPAATPAGPGHRGGGARCARQRAHRRVRGPGRAAGRAGGPLRGRRAQPRGRPGRERADRDARGDRAAAAARAGVRADPAARRRPLHRRVAGPVGPSRASGRDHAVRRTSARAGCLVPRRPRGAARHDAAAAYRPLRSSVAPGGPGPTTAAAAPPPSPPAAVPARRRPPSSRPPPRRPLPSRPRRPSPPLPLLPRRAG